MLAFALSSLGVAIASHLKTMESFQVVMNFVMMPLLFLSGAFFPVRGLPNWLEVLIHLDPVAYGVDALRQVVLGSVLSDSTAVSSFGLSGPNGTNLPVLADAGVLVLIAIPVLALAVHWFRQTD
jgi:ABC-2 type transport system permease protein